MKTSRKQAIQYLKKRFSLSELKNLGFVNIESYEDVPRNAKRKSVLSAERRYKKIVVYLRKRPGNISERERLLKAKRKLCLNFPKWKYLPQVDLTPELLEAGAFY